MKRAMAAVRMAQKFEDRCLTELTNLQMQLRLLLDQRVEMLLLKNHLERL